MARKFSFRFESILNLKEKEEENKKAILGIATKSLKQEEEQLTHLLQQKNEIHNQLKLKTQSKLQIKDLQFFASKLEFADQLIDKQKLAVTNCEDHLNKCRFQLIEAKKQTKVFDILKEKDYADHTYLQLKDEEIFLDQLVSYKTASK